jgi:hypothetical protein
MMYKTPNRKLKIEQHELHTKNRVLQEGKQFLIRLWYPSRYSCYKPGDKSWMRKGLDYDYDKRNSSMVICDTDIP